MTYVLALLHFNLQYCAGGLDGLWVDGWPADNDSLEDQMIVESFAPVLDLLDRHPTWGLDLELQARMVEVLAERHPDVLDHLRTLAQSGQVELVSFHYSDQLWTAYPWRDQQKSLDLVRQVFDANDLPLSRVVFTQEGQFGPGMLQRMPQYGYDVAVLAHNLAQYQWGHDPDAPAYDAGGGVTVVPGNGVAGAGYGIEWSYLNDGELLATNGLNCYLGAAFVYSPSAVAAYEADLQAREDAGAVISTVGAYVDAVKDQGAPALPPIADGTWQPDDTGNLFRWMGGGGIFVSTEQDGAVLTRGATVEREIAAAEVVAGADAADPAWRELLLGQVSDATGWNPYVTETEYALDHFDAAEQLALDAIGPACEGHDAVAVDLGTGAVAWDPDPVEPVDSPADAPDVGFVAGERVASTTWTRSDPDVWRVEVAVDPGEGVPSVSFAWDPSELATTAALVDDAVFRIDPAPFQGDPFGMPLPIGLAGLSPGWWLVEDTARVHLAGRFSTSAGAVEVRDETLAPESAATWVFYVVQGDDARALEIADRVNVNPTVTLACPPRAVAPPGDDGGCGCQSAPGVGWIASLPLVLRRRR